MEGGWYNIHFTQYKECERVQREKVMEYQCEIKVIYRKAGTYITSSGCRSFYPRIIIPSPENFPQKSFIMSRVRERERVFFPPLFFVHFRVTSESVNRKYISCLVWGGTHPDMWTPEIEKLFDTGPSYPYISKYLCLLIYVKTFLDIEF